MTTTTGPARGPVMAATTGMVSGPVKKRGGPTTDAICTQSLSLNNKIFLIERIQKEVYFVNTRVTNCMYYSPPLSLTSSLAGVDKEPYALLAVHLYSPASRSSTGSMVSV